MSRALTRGVPYWTPIIVIALALLALHLLWDILIIFLISALLAFVMRPVVNRFDRFLPRVIAILVVYLLLAAILLTIGRELYPLVSGQFGSFIESTPQFVEEGRDLFNRLQRTYLRLPGTWQGLVDSALAELQEFAGRLTSQAIPAVVQAVELIATLFIIPVLTFFILAGYEGYGRMILALTPRRSRHSIVTLGRRLSDSLWASIRGQSLLMIAVGTATGIGLYLVGMPYPIVFGIIAGLLEVIPNFGPTITFIAVTVVGLLISPILALKAAAVATGVQLLENSLLSPVILAKAVDVSPLTVALAVFIGGALHGALGILVAIPLSVMVKVVLLYFYAQDSDVVATGRRCTERSGDVPAG